MTKTRIALAACLLFSPACLPSLSRAVAADAAQTVRVKAFMRGHCHKCHGDKQQEGDLRLDTLPLDFVNATSVSRWTEILDRINSGAMPPEGETRPNPAEAIVVVNWIAASLAEAEAARHAGRERVNLYRLTREEYAHTIFDLLGVRTDVTDPGGLLPDEEWHGLERIGSVLSFSPGHVEKYYAAAEAILAEAFPEKTPQPISRHKDALDLRSEGNDRAELTRLGLAEKVRVELWPGATIIGRGGPGVALPAAGLYRVRVKLSGLKPDDGPAPHLSFYVQGLDRVLYERDVVAPEAEPVVIEFETHLPPGHHDVLVRNSVAGPPVSPATSRTRRPFFSVKEGRSPWQIKLTDEEDRPLLPFLIIDWIEWEGPLPVPASASALRDAPADAGDEASLRTYLTDLAGRAFRRPVQPAEISRLVSLVQAELARGEQPKAALDAARTAVLCSNDFCCLVEGHPDSDSPFVNDWELASRLSYFLWSSMPDEALFQAATTGRLRQPGELRSQVHRMLGDPKAARFAESFPRQWLQLHKVGMFPPDKKLYPEYDAYLEKSMIGETVAFFGEILRQNLSLREFLDSDWTMLNLRLAAHYRIPDVGADQFVRVALRPEDHRGGLLTQASVLSLSSDGARHRPVHRGKWVLESIVGKPPPPPPGNVEPIEPTPADRPKASLRDKLAAHTRNATCVACHRQIDPLGLAFENYDAIGRWRTHEIVGDGQGDNPPVDSSGELPDGRTFDDAGGFKRLLLADLDRFNAVFVEKLATYALRRTMSFDDRQALAEIAGQSSAADYRLKAIIEALVLSELFRRR